jgi:hypothetical protein
MSFSRMITADRVEFSMGRRQIWYWTPLYRRRRLKNESPATAGRSRRRPEVRRANQFLVFLEES